MLISQEFSTQGCIDSAPSSAPAAHCEAQIEALRNKIATLEAVRSRMCKVNSLIRNRNLRGLRQLGYSDAHITKLMNPVCHAGEGFFPSYKLRNSASKIRALTAELKELESSLHHTDFVIQQRLYTYTENDAEGRAEFRFMAKPDKRIRAELKRYGFMHGTGQFTYERQLCSAAVRAANCLRNFVDNYLD